MYLLLTLMVTPAIIPVSCVSIPFFGNFNFFQTVSNIGETIYSELVPIFSLGVDIYHLDPLAPEPEDASLNISQLVHKYGYVFEEHTVTTEDGYILSLHRVKKKQFYQRDVVFLMHGIMDSSDSWVLQGPGNALAYILADKGYDVWLGNARGNKHANKHITLRSNQSDYWKFTWEEIGIYDLPAMIDYALSASRQKSLYYIGHSQGTTCFFVMGSLRPEYNEKVKAMFALAPVAWMKHAKSPIALLFSPAHRVLGWLLGNFNTYVSTLDYFNKIASLICRYTPRTCDNVLYYIAGSCECDTSLIPVILRHMPTGSSTLQFVHFGQLVESGRFRRFDHGLVMNYYYYGQRSPPDYDLSFIKMPISLFYGGDDWLSDPDDVYVLKKHLKNVVNDVYIEMYNHIDFMYGSSSKDYIYDVIVKYIDVYSNSNGK